MANNLVWKMNVGPSTHIDTTSTPYHAGYGYLTTDEPSGGFYIDANNKRYHINEVDATLSKSGVAADAAAVNTRFGNILGGSREKHNEVLLASGWATPSGQDYAARYDITTLNARYATGEWQMEVNVDSLTGAQRAALMDAEIMNGQASQYLYAYGVKPGVDIPVVMTAYTEGATAPTSNYVRVTVVGSTDFADDWLALEGGVSALTPEEGLIYMIVDDGYNGSRAVYWDDTEDEYVPVVAVETGKIHLVIPKVFPVNPTYKGSTPITLASRLVGFNPDIMELEGVTTTGNGSGGTRDAGSYTGYVKIKSGVSDLYDWITENSQTGAIEYVSTRQELTWAVDKVKLPKPCINGSDNFDYTGSVQGPNISNEDGIHLTRIGSISGTNAQSYVVIYAINDTDNYEWEDGTNGNVQLDWKINKVNPTLSVSSNIWMPDKEELTKSVTISTDSDGTLSVASGDTSMVTVSSISNKVFTMASVNGGEANITVSLAAGTNWNASSVAISYKGNFFSLAGTTFASCTNDELEKIIDAYYNGKLTAEKIKNSSGWRIGSTRAVTLAAQSAIGETSTLTGGVDYTSDNTAITSQTVYMEIIGYEHDTLATPINGKTKALFTLQQKDMISGCNMYWNRGTGNGTSNEKIYGSHHPDGWAGSRIRTWLNAGYDISELPSIGTYDYTSRTLTKPTSNDTVGYWKALANWALRSLIKPVIKPNYKINGSSAIDIWTVDPIWLPSEWEIFGSKTYSKGQEGEHYNEKYSSASSRIKQKGGSNSYWWTRSVQSSYAYNACGVNAGGDASGSACGFSGSGLGVAPAFCI